MLLEGDKDITDNTREIYQILNHLKLSLSFQEAYLKITLFSKGKRLKQWLWNIFYAII